MIKSISLPLYAHSFMRPGLCLSVGLLSLSLSFAVVAESAAPQAIDKSQPAVIEADFLRAERYINVEAKGNVLLQKQDQQIRTQHLQYQQQLQKVNVQGGVTLEQPGARLSGEALELDLQSGSGTVEQPSFYLEQNAGHGAAQRLTIHDKQHFELEDASYSVCKPDDEAWVLRTRKLEIDQERQVGIAHHVRIEFLGVPILYAPWLDFSLNNQRKSGFMSPIFGSTERGGLEITTPYYWNIAANRDATFAPRVMEKRGVLLNNEFRYLESGFHGELEVNILPWDKIAERERGEISWQHYQGLPSNINAYLDINRVSDNDYYRDLSDTISNTSQVNLTQELGVHYDSEHWQLRLRGQRFQTLQDAASPIVTPYYRLPQLSLHAQQQFGGLELKLDGEYVDFQHATLVSGSRLVLNPQLSYSLMKHSGYYAKPVLALHSSRYQLDENNSQQLPDRSRHLPVFSLDSGATFERQMSLGGRTHIQTLEPRAFYVYIPYDDQSRLPNFDSAEADFSFTQMFTENRFFGKDRIGDANQLTLALGSRILRDENGAERFNLLVGQRFSFETPKVFLDTPEDAQSSRSDMLMVAGGQLTQAWSLNNELQYDPDRSQVQRYNFAAHYQPQKGKLLNLGYRFIRDSLRHVDVSAQWPLSNKWHAVGRWNYSLLDKQLLEAIAGVEYNRDCWTLRFVAQRFATATEQKNTSFFMQLELNDLIKVGSDPLDLLKDSVYGYSKTNKQPETSSADDVE